MSERDDFLANIRGSLGRSAPLDAPVSDAPHSAGPPGELDARVEAVRELISRDADNLMSVLARVAETSGWKVARVADARAAGEYVLGVAREIEARSLVYSLHQVVRDAMPLDALSEAGMKAEPVALGHDSEAQDAEDRARLRTVMEASDIGVTGVDYAISETGTCVIIPRAGVSRLVSLLPPVHIALVERGQVIPSLDELFTLRRDDFVNGELGSYMNLITGPSRSADIEYKLITGVHGPGEVHMVLVG